MAIYVEQLLNNLRESCSEEREIGKFYSFVKDYYDKIKKSLVGEIEEKNPRFCFEIKDDETALIKILKEKNIPCELNYLDGKSKPSLLKIFNQND